MKKLILAAAAGLLSASAAIADDRTAADRKPAFPLTIEEIFRVAQNPVFTTRGMVMSVDVTPEVLIMRRNDDGTYSRACVDSAAAARAFFAVPNERRTAEAKEK